MKRPKWSYKYPERWDRLQLHYNFLKKTEVDCGTLWCEYCGLSDLKIYAWYDKPNRLDMATVDHFFPKSKYPELANEETNFIVSCSHCNENKKDGIWSENDVKFSRLIK